MGSRFRGTPRAVAPSQSSLARSLIIGGAITILVAAAIAPFLGALIDTSVKGESLTRSFVIRELTNMIGAACAIAVLALTTRIQRRRLQRLSTLLLISGLAVLTFTITRFVLQLSARQMDTSTQGKWIGPEILVGLLLLPILLTVLSLLAQRERIVATQTVLIDEARRALQDDHEALRSRVFDHLHGTVTSELVVARVRLNDLSKEIADPAVSAEVVSVAESIRRLHELEVRRLAHVMVASGLDTSLDEALHQIAASCEGLCEVSVHIDPEYSEIDRRLPADARATLRLTLYRVIEECISNALRHAHAEHVEVSIAAQHNANHGEIEVRVTNDGESLESDPEPGVGMRVIAARLTPYEGSLATTVTSDRFMVTVRLRVAL